MAFINKTTGQIGSLYQLLPNVSNPTLLTEQELLAMNIEKYIPEPVVEELPTLEEYKVLKWKQLSQEVHAYVTEKYPYYKQLSALNGTYDEATNTEIKTWCDTEVKRALSIKSAIDLATAHADVDAIFYRKPIYAEGDTEQIEPIDYEFWVM